MSDDIKETVPTKEALREVIRRELAADARARKAERQLESALERADEANRKRQRARQHCIQVVGQCLSGGDSQLAADALFNMIGLLYDEADDTQLYPPAAQDAPTPPATEVA